MATKQRQSFSGLISEAELLMDGFKKNSADLKGSPVKLEGYQSQIGKVKELNLKQERLKAETQETTKQLELEIKELMQTISRLRSYLQSYYGKKSEKLELFGIKPYKSGGKRGARKP